MLRTIAVSHEGKIQYYIVYLAGEGLQDTDEIEWLMTDNLNYSTREGVSVGTFIKEAQKIYGQSTLSYNTNNESREYVQFANQPSSNIRFRSSSDEGFAGIYQQPTQEYNQTNVFADTAVIDMIEVINNN